MSNVIPFDFHGHSVRVINVDHDPWFLARDVAEILEYKNPLKAIRDHCKGVNETVLPSAGGPQTVKIIPERDVYRLVMRSKLPAAEEFEEWVVGEVLPSIRKTGGYQVGRVTLPDFSNPAEAARAWADQHEKTLKLERERNEAQRTKAWIGSKREATAMAKASAATRKANELERRLGQEENWKRVKAIPWLAEEFAITRTMYQQVGKKLKAISDEMGLEIDKSPDSEYGEVKIYHIDAINELWRRLQEDSELLARYRKEKAA